MSFSGWFLCVINQKPPPQQKKFDFCKIKYIITYYWYMYLLYGENLCSKRNSLI